MCILDIFYRYIKFRRLVQVIFLIKRDGAQKVTHIYSQLFSQMPVKALLRLDDRHAAVD